MANHVTSYITFENLSEEAKKFLMTLSEIDGENKEQDQIKYFYDDYKEEMNWYGDNIGSKWMYFDYVDEDNFCVVSAWVPTFPFYNKVFETLSQLDSPDLRMWVQYEDEMPNFIGVYGLDKDMDYKEELGEEYYEDVLGMLPYDEVSEEFNDGSDGRPNFWEEVQDWFSKEYNYFKHLDDLFTY